MTREEFDEILDRTNAVVCNREWYERAVKALEMVEEFEKAQIITGGRLNGRTYAYKCGLEDGKRKALEQEPTEKCKWIKYDYRTMCPKEHDVDNPYWRIPENRMETLKYCPYCGKEIEVEE